MSEELLDEARVGVSGDEAAGCVAQGVETQRAKSCCVACRLEPSADEALGMDLPIDRYLAVPTNDQPIQKPNLQTT